MLAALMCPKGFFLQPIKSQQTFCSNRESNIVSLQKGKYDDANCKYKYRYKEILFRDCTPTNQDERIPKVVGYFFLGRRLFNAYL